MKKVLASLGLFVFLTTLSYPLSAEAFGKRPSSSEVYQNQRSQPGPGAPNNPRSDSPAREHLRTPEPSLIVLLGIGGSLVVLVSMRNWLRRAVSK